MNYPKWKHLLPIHPTREQYVNAFKSLFNAHPDQCVITRTYHSYHVKAPNNFVHNHGGFGKTTETPVTSDNINYSGRGPDWAIDDNNERYWLIHDNGKPSENAFNIEIINRYNDKQYVREQKLKRICQG